MSFMSRQAVCRRRKSFAALLACLVTALCGGLAATAAAREPAFGIEHFSAAATDSAGAPYTQAGGHPFQLTTEVDLATVPLPCGGGGGGSCDEVEPVYNPRDIHVELPPGLLTNPSAAARCVSAAFFASECDAAAQIGTVAVRYGGKATGFSELAPLYDLVPSGGNWPAELGFGSALPFAFGGSVRGGSDFGINTLSDGLPVAGITAVRTEIWGVPASPPHTALRGKQCIEPATKTEDEFLGECEAQPGGVASEEEADPRPFLTMPTDCTGEALPVVATADSWPPPEEEVEAREELPAVEGCNALAGHFKPTLEARPTTNLAGAPSGFEFDLGIPQSEDPEGLATPQLREATVTLPPGLALNPSAANGLAACSPAQVGLESAPGATPVRFSEAPVGCPDAAKIGTVEIDTPLLAEPLGGELYLASPHANPFGSLLAAYAVLEGQGLVMKLAGHFEIEPESGRLLIRFADMPQLPFAHFKLDLFGGALGALRTPPTCGPFEVSSLLTPYSAPESGPPAQRGAEFEIWAPPGGACPNSLAEMPFAPRLRAGAESVRGGGFAAFFLRLSRKDDTRGLGSLDTTLPPGLSAKLAGIPSCPDTAIEAAAARGGPSGGRDELEHPSCPAASQVGTVEVALGAGPDPYYVTGDVYLAGPYAGAPLSLAIIVPAIAGPFDLGTVVNRVAVAIDPETARLTLRSGPLPSTLEGIPLDLRSLTLRIDRPGFVHGPTDCEPMTVEGMVSGAPLPEVEASPPSAALSVPFQASGCAALGFGPGLSLRLTGGLGPNGHPGLRAVLRAHRGEAGIAGASFALPAGELLDFHHVRALCARQLPPERCPAGSRLGYARVWSPLLDGRLEGPVYLREPSRGLPDLLADLRDGRIRFLLRGKTMASAGRLGVRFPALPDFPLSKAVFTLAGGRRGIFVNSESLCARPRRAAVTLSAHNGKLRRLRPELRLRGRC